MKSGFAKIGVMDMLLEAIERFGEAFERAKTSGVKDATAMTLASATLNGKPSIRTVLLKGFDLHGFVFFTNYESRKGRELTSNPQAALCFFWPPIDQQIIIEGFTMPVPSKEADAYWQTRPRESQIGAWASYQSRPLESRALLEKRFFEYEQKHAGKKIPRPPHWSGFRLIPSRIEFWNAGPHRLHDRMVYEKKEDGWHKGLLFP